MSNSVTDFCHRTFGLGETFNRLLAFKQCSDMTT